MKNKIKYLLVICLALLALGGYSANIKSTSTGGNWSNTTTWTSGTVPGANDNVEIDGPVTINTNAICKTLKINASKSLSFNNGEYSLTLKGTWTTVLEIKNNGTFNAGDGRVIFNPSSSTGQTVSGTIAFNNVEVNNVSQMTFSGTSTINGTILLTNDGKITSHPTYGSNATMKIKGAYNISTNRYLWGATGNNVPPNIVIDSGSVIAQQATDLVKTLTINQGATLDLSASCITLKSTFQGITNNGTTTLGGVTLESGTTWNIGSDITLSNLKIPSGATVNAGSSIINFTYNTTGNCNASGKIIELVGTGTFNAQNSTAVVNASSNGNGSFSGNVVLNNVVLAGGTLNTTSSNITINGNLTVNSGTDLNYGNSIPTGTVTFGSSSTITNNGGTTSNITTSVPSAPTPTTVDQALKVLDTSNNGGGTFDKGLRLNAPSIYELNANLEITGLRKVLIIYSTAEFVTNGYTISADSVYVYGKLIVSNDNGLSAFLNSTKIYIDEDAIIEFSSDNKQTVNARTYGTLKFSGTGEKELASGTYTIKKNLEIEENTVSFVNNPTFTFNGNRAQSIAGLPFKNVNFGGSGNKTLADTTKVTGVVTLDGTANLISNGFLTLTSTASGTASIGAVAATASITGAVNYERYIPAGRLWRFIGWPISGTTVANSLQTTIHVTGPGTGGSLGGFNSNGFDWTSSGNASIFKYTETINSGINNKWEGIANTSTALNSTTGYRLFIRGDRALGTSLLNGSNHTVEPVLLKGTGTINTGNITVSLTSSNGGGTDNGWHLLANPYPSAIDWNNATWVSERSASIQSTVYVYNPSQNRYGAWNVNSGGVNGGSSEIASGQAFFVKTNAAANLTFRESFKVNNSTVGLFGKTSSTALINNLKISIGETNKIYDETIVYFNNNATKNFDNEYDALKPDATNASISSYTTTSTDKLLINAIPYSQLDTVYLNTPVANASYNYLLRLTGAETFLDSNNTITLIDNFTQNQFIISEANNVYAYSTVVNNNGSQAANRFMLVFNNQNQQLPVKLISFNANKTKQNLVELNWSTTSEKLNKHFEIERSDDGILFEPIGLVNGNGNSTTLKKYNFIDQNPSAGINYYRLKQVDYNGEYTHSNVVLIDLYGNKLSATIKPTVYPIPANKQLNIELNNDKLSTYSISVTDLLGNEISSETVMASELNYIHQVNITGLTNGVYLLKISNGQDNTEVLKFIKE